GAGRSGVRSPADGGLREVRSEQEVRMGFEDCRDAHRVRARRRIAVWKTVGIGLARVFGDLGDVSAQIERRTGLVETNVPIATDTEDREVQAANLADAILVAATLGLRIHRRAVRDKT